MYNSLKAIVVFILLPLFMRQSSLYAQLNTPPTRYVSKTFDNKNGLPQNTVYDVVKDNTGMLYIGTDEGLAIYDGNVFNVHNEENTEGLTSSAFYDLCPASGSGIWAASRNNIVLYKQHHIEVFDFTSLFKGSWITSITEDRFGKLWVGTNSGSLFYLEGKQLIPFEKWRTRYRQNIQVLRPYQNGVLAGTDRGLFNICSSAITEVKELHGKNIRALESDTAESMWVGTKGDGLFRIGDSVVHFTEKQGLLELFITSLAVQPNGHLWIGTSTSGLQKFAEGNFAPFKESSFLHDRVRCILPDNGVLWIGTTGSGLFQMIPAEVDMLRDVPALSDNIILPIYQHTSGDIWIGTAGNGVYRISNGKTTHYTKRSGLSGEIILSIGGTKDALFIGTPEGLTRVNLRTSKIDQHYTVRKGLINDIVQTIFTDSRQRVWIGTHSGGIHFMQGDSIVTVRTPSKFDKAEFVSAFEDRNGNIWFGTSGTGILKLTADERIEQFNMNLGLSADMVYGFYEDREGDLWLATQAGLVNYANGKFSVFNKSNGLSYNGIYRIIDDGNGSLWLSGNFGIQQVAIRNLLNAKNKTAGNPSLHARLFDVSDGMSNAEANGGIFPAGWKMHNGSIWFPTVKGIAIINPLQIKTSLPELKVRIQSVNFGEQTIPPGSKISIPPGVFNIEIDYGSIHFTKQHTINYFIRMPGIDTTWENVGNRRTAYYTSLHPGHYIFEVKAEQFGRFSDVATLVFTVEPFFYQTRWFNTGMLVLLFMSGIFIKQLHSKYRRETILKKLVEERTVALKESHMRFKKQELELTKAVVHAQEHERFQIGAELHDNVNQLLATARLTLSLVKQTVQVRHEEWLDKTGKYIGEAINEIRALSHRLAPPSFGEHSLKEAIKGLIDSINVDQRYTAQVDVDDCDGLENIEKNIQLTLYRILQEQLKNISKYSCATKLLVCLRQQEKKICMTVVDNGIGFDIKTVKRGIGINNMKKRAEMFNGTFDLQSSPGDGCKLTVEIPLG